jgi:hypothetical protein
LLLKIGQLEAHLCSPQDAAGLVSWQCHVVGNLANLVSATWQCGLGDVYLTIWTEYGLNKLLIHFNNKVNFTI